MFLGLQLTATSPLYLPLDDFTIEMVAKLYFRHFKFKYTSEVEYTSLSSLDMYVQRRAWHTLQHVRYM
jgi:hypothetical protein